MPSKLLKKLSKPKICVMDICIPLVIVVIALLYVYRAEVMNFLPSHKGNEAFTSVLDKLKVAVGIEKPPTVWENMKKSVGIEEPFGGCASQAVKKCEQDRKNDYNEQKALISKLGNALERCKKETTCTKRYV